MKYNLIFLENFYYIQSIANKDLDLKTGLAQMDYNNSLGQGYYFLRPVK